MKFSPAYGYIQVEKLANASPLADDNRVPESARVIKRSNTDYDIGDILFFRPHGFFELEHEDKKYYVVRDSEEFILGVLKNVEEK